MRRRCKASGEGWLLYWILSTGVNDILSPKPPHREALVSGAQSSARYRSIRLRRRTGNPDEQDGPGTVPQDPRGHTPRPNRTDPRATVRGNHDEIYLPFCHRIEQDPYGLPTAHLHRYLHPFFAEPGPHSFQIRGSLGGLRIEEGGGSRRHQLHRRTALAGYGRHRGHHPREEYLRLKGMGDRRRARCGDEA